MEHSKVDLHYLLMHELKSWKIFLRRSTVRKDPSGPRVMGEILFESWRVEVALLYLFMDLPGQFLTPPLCISLLLRGRSQIRWGGRLKDRGMMKCSAANTHFFLSQSVTTSPIAAAVWCHAAVRLSPPLSSFCSALKKARGPQHQSMNDLKAVI